MDWKRSDSALTDAFTARMSSERQSPGLGQEPIRNEMLFDVVDVAAWLKAKLKAGHNEAGISDQRRMTMRKYWWEKSTDEEVERIWPEDIADILEDMRKTIPNATREDAVAVWREERAVAHREIAKWDEERRKNKTPEQIKRRQDAIYAVMANKDAGDHVDSLVRFPTKKGK
jgi:hypothetical protein